MSVPSVVFAEASWYGSLRGGVGSNADGQTGIADVFSRFGVKGSSEVSEGLTAIYNFEHSIGPTGNLGEGGRHHYVGLSGGFGTLTIGQTNSASFNNIAAITDNAYFLGAGSGVTSRTAGVKYSVSVENISIQADAVMNRGDGLSKTPATVDAAAVAEDKNIDQVEIGASMALGENGKIAFAHISYDSYLKTKKTQNFVAGQYSIGGMTGYLGLSQTKSSDDTLVGTEMSGDTVDGSVDLVYKRATTRDSGTYAGVRGSVGDTGISYVFQVVKMKSKSTNAGESGTNSVPGVQGGTANPATASTPWMISLARSLGGGATVVFEHSNPDDKASKSSSVLALVIGF